MFSQSWMDFFAFSALLLGVVAYIPYVHSVIINKTKPHMFSWVVWGLLPTIAFFAQQTSGAGKSAWVTLMTGVCCLLIAALSFFKGEKNITRSDWAVFLSSLAIIPIYLATDNPLLAVSLVATIDTLALIPTLRKSWHKPEEEFLFTYIINGIKWVLAFLALSEISLTTALYPVVLIFSNGGFAVTNILRRRYFALAAQKPNPASGRSH
jgi:hypothetical protein